VSAPRVPRMAAASLERLRTSLPLTAPDRHAMDTVADEAFAALAPGRPDLAASIAAGFEPPIDWTVDPPESTRRRVTDTTPAGGAL
jgi:hypothetical protein